MRTFGEWEVRGDARAETRFRFRTGLMSVVPSLVVSGSGSPQGVANVKIVAASRDERQSS
jgi:hypothetical protein